ncbi:MAG: dTMP kinase [Betaproteobacteria bacterium]|nr:MAG: dTMP kinase [Betaproteobacteria bacterium]TAG50351.1 MAG: dTMP kinase [Betaproteobacteria bacterium]
MNHAKFITFEGIDGAGKSSHVELARTIISSAGFSVLCTREPGGTMLGEKVRELFLAHAMSPHTEALLVFAARREHLEKVVWPALTRGEWVLCDRFTDATMAYQGAGRQIGAEFVDALASLVHPGFVPDMTLLFDLPPDAAQDRVAGRGAADRIEAESVAFHERVRRAYLERAAAEPQRIRVLDTRESKQAVADRVAGYVEALLP